MPQRCVVGNCSNNEFPAHSWPKDATQAAAWRKFVKSTRKYELSINAQTSICCLHFESESFAKIQGFKSGYGLLRLSPGAVPTIRNCGDNPLKDLFIHAISQRNGKGW